MQGITPTQQFYGGMRQKGYWPTHILEGHAELNPVSIYASYGETVSSDES